MGDEIRRAHAGVGPRVLRIVFGKRRKAVLASVAVCWAWHNKYVGTDEAPAKKRRRGEPVPPPGVSAAASSSGQTPSIQLDGADAVEKACGSRYRKEVTDLGLGFAAREMVSKLRTRGYDASREGCQEWLRKYRLCDGAKDGGVGVYVLSCQHLQRWFHVEKLSPTYLQERYRAESGVYADRSDLVCWLNAPAQALPYLQDNIDVLSNPCGAHVLHQLQNGVSPAVVVQEVLEQYLARTTGPRVLAYRRLFEEKGGD